MKIPTNDEAIIYQIRMPYELKVKLRVMAGLRDLTIAELLEEIINKEYEKTKLL